MAITIHWPIEGFTLQKKCFHGRAFHSNATGMAANTVTGSIGTSLHAWNSLVKNDDTCFIIAPYAASVYVRHMAYGSRERRIASRLVNPSAALPACDMHS